MVDVVAGVDGSEAGHNAVRWAAREAQRRKAPAASSHRVPVGSVAVPSCSHRRPEAYETGTYGPASIVHATAMLTATPAEHPRTPQRSSTSCGHRTTKPTTVKTADQGEPADHVGGRQLDTTSEVTMIACVGDRLVIKGIHVGDRHRVGIITKLQHADGTPPYEVRWLDNDHVALVFPGPQAHVESATDVQ